MPDMATMRKLIEANHGGMQAATDTEIKTIWNTLPEDIRERYLEQVKDDRTGPQSDSGRNARIGPRKA